MSEPTAEATQEPESDERADQEEVSDLLFPSSASPNVHDDSVTEELELLRSIYVHELDVKCAVNGRPETITLDVHPQTADKTEEQYVRLTLVLTLPPQYPVQSPLIRIRNSRGLGDEDLERIVADLREKAEQEKGNQVLYVLIEAAKDHLTQSNTPRGQCPICLFNFSKEDAFTKTGCYHHFHVHCLGRYVEATLAEAEAEETQSEQKQKIVCPVCREPITYDLDSLLAAPLPVESEAAEEFTLTSQLKEQQETLASLYLHQKEIGGIIDVEAESKKYLLEISSTAASTSGDTKTAITTSVAEMPSTSAEEPVDSSPDSSPPSSGQRRARSLKPISTSPPLKDWALEADSPEAQTDKEENEFQFIPKGEPKSPKRRSPTDLERSEDAVVNGGESDGGRHVGSRGKGRPRYGYRGNRRGQSSKPPSHNRDYKDGYVSSSEAVLTEDSDVNTSPDRRGGGGGSGGGGGGMGRGRHSAPYRRGRGRDGPYPRGGGRGSHYSNKGQFYDEGSYSKPPREDRQFQPRTDGGRGYGYDNNYRPRSDSRGRSDYSKRGNRGDFSRRGDRSDFSRRGDRGDYSRRGDRGDLPRRGERGDHSRRGDRGDLSRRGDRSDYSRRSEHSDEYPRRGGDRGGSYPRRGGGRRGGYNHDHNGPPQQQRDVAPRYSSHRGGNNSNNNSDRHYDGGYGSNTPRPKSAPAQAETASEKQQGPKQNHHPSKPIHPSKQSHSNASDDGNSASQKSWGYGPPPATFRNKSQRQQHQQQQQQQQQQQPPAGLADSDPVTPPPGFLSKPPFPRSKPSLGYMAS